MHVHVLWVCILTLYALCGVAPIGATGSSVLPVGNINGTLN